MMRHALGSRRAREEARLPDDPLVSRPSARLGADLAHGVDTRARAGTQGPRDVLFHHFCAGSRVSLRSPGTRERSTRLLTRQPGAIVRRGQVDRGSFRNDAGRVDARDRPIIDHVVARRHRLGDAGQRIELAHVVREVGVVGDALPVAAEQREISDVEAHQRRKQAPVGLGDAAAGAVGLAREPGLELVEGGEQRVVGGLVGGLRLGEAAAVDAVVDIGIDEVVEAIDLGPQRRGVEVGAVSRDAVELAVEHADDFGGLVVDDPPRLLVPQRRDRDLAGVTRIGGGIGLVQVAEAVHGVGRAVREVGVVGEGPALLPQPRHRIGDRDRAGELLDRTVDQSAVRPRAAVGDVEMIASGLGLESGRAVRRDAVAEAAVGAAKVAAAAGFLRQLAVAPGAVDQNAHYAASPRASVAALRMAAMLARYASGPPRLNTAEPATSALAPARATIGAFSAVMPPSTSMSIGRAPTSARSRAIFSAAYGMKVCPPKPGLTDITRMRSTRSISGSIALSGVPGLSVTPAFLPSARIACSERCTCGPASTCTVMMSEPAAAKASR